jgi:4-hydroxy-4-methyl-2-oxoglutarate aldolase
MQPAQSRDRTKGNDGMNNFQSAGIVVRNITRADPAAVERLGRLGVATVHEAQKRTGMLQPTCAPVWPKAAGLRQPRSPSLAQPGDNWMLHVAAEADTPATSSWSA